MNVPQGYKADCAVIFPGSVHQIDIGKNRRRLNWHPARLGFDVSLLHRG
jgi:hypothetical protein